MVMFGEHQARCIEVRVDLAQFTDEHALLKQLFAEPERHGFHERRKSARRESKIGFQQPLELEEWLVVKHHVVDVAQSGAGRFQAIANRLMRKAFVELLAREAFLMGRGDDFAVADESGGAIMVICGDPKNAHCLGQIRSRSDSFAPDHNARSAVDATVLPAPILVRTGLRAI
jgi:hypothetical protein